MGRIRFDLTSGRLVEGLIWLFGVGTDWKMASEHGWAYGELNGRREHDAVRDCPVDRTHETDDTTKRLGITLYGGKWLPDFLGLTNHGYAIASADMIRRLRDSRLTGYTARDRVNVPENYSSNRQPELYPSISPAGPDSAGAGESRMPPTSALTAGRSRSSARDAAGGASTTARRAENGSTTAEAIPSNRTVRASSWRRDRRKWSWRGEIGTAATCSAAGDMEADGSPIGGPRTGSIERTSSASISSRLLNVEGLRGRLPDGSSI